MCRKLIIALGIICLGVLVYTSASAQAPAKPDLIEVMEEVNGTITQHTASAVAARVEKIGENPKVKAVLLVVNTPGGGVLASDVVRQEIGKIKVPVVAFCEYVCASGGVYVLTASSIKFVAIREEAITGSVGVLMVVSRYNRLLEWAKIDNETFKSGALKDAGNPTRPSTDADRAYLQGMVDESALRFYGLVQKARPKADMTQIKTARLFVGEAGVKVGLADAVMSREQALKKAKDLSGSKLIFTREELKKMSKAADENSHMEAPIKRGAPAFRSWEQSLSEAMDLLHEVRSGEVMQLEYRMPYRF